MPPVTTAIPLNKFTNPRGIDPQRLIEITQSACDRLRECRNEMGLDTPSGQLWAVSPIGRQNTWGWTRQIAYTEYRGNFMHRRALGGVFSENGSMPGGLSLNVPARMVAELSSKMSEDLVGSDPFFAAMPEHINDPDKEDLAKETEQKCQDEITRSNLAATIRQAIKDAMIVGERAVKLTWQNDSTTYIGDAVVMVDAQGDPIKTPKGGYVYQHDSTIDVLVNQQGEFVAAFDPATMLDQNGQPQIPEGMTFQTRLEREPDFLMPQEPVWQMVNDLEMTLTHHDGLVADVLFTEDFIFPIFCARLEEADIMAHCYDASLDDIEAQYPGTEYSKKVKTAQEAKQARKKGLDLQETGALSSAGSAIIDLGEQQRETRERPLINIHETYYRCRVNPTDKNESWLFMVLDLVNEVPIFVDYIGNMRMKKPPFILIRGFESVSGRAYGIGIYEKFRDKSLAIDQFWNRLCAKSGKSQSVTFFHPSAFEETNDGEDLIIGNTQVYRLRKDAQWLYEHGMKPVDRINLAEVDEFTRPVMQDAIQTVQLETGMNNAADADSSALLKGGTATEIRNIERTGNTIQRQTENMLVDDVTACIEMAVDIILENLDPEETKWIADEQRIAKLSLVEMRMLPREVRILLTKSEASEGIEIAQQVLATIKEYYGYPPQLQKKLRSAFIQILKDLDRPDADEILHDPTDAEIKAASEAQASQAKINEQFRAMLSDVGPLTPYERAQILAMFNVQASPDSDVQAAQAQQQAAENPAPPGQPGQIVPMPPPPQPPAAQAQ